MPARKIPKNYRNVTGAISSQKANHLISFESKLERDFYYLFDFDQSVVGIEDQPFTINYYIGEEVRSYTPDVFLTRIPGLPHIIGEVKHYEDLKAEWPRLRPKFEAAIAYAKMMPEPTKFVIFTERCPMIANVNYLKNVHFLDDYNRFSYEDIEIIKDLYWDGMTLRDLLEAYSDSQQKQMMFVPTIWSMVKRLVIDVDLTKKLTLATPILGVRNMDEVIDLIIERGMKI